MRLCPACNGADARPAFVVGGHPLVRCHSCASLYVDPIPSAGVVAAIYAQTDYYDQARKHESRLRAEAVVRAAMLARRGVRSVLEVGCAAGYFLDALREYGIRAEGVEPGPAGDDAIRAGHVVHRCYLEELPQGVRDFDAVALWEVVEHTGDPLALLRAAVARLRPGGFLALSTPSMSGVPALLLGRRFPMITPPEHLTLMSARGLRRLLFRAGLAIETQTSFSNLTAPQIASGLQRFALGRSRAAERVARALGKLGEPAVRLVDRLGLGTEIEVVARLERAPLGHESVSAS